MSKPKRGSNIPRQSVQRSLMMAKRNMVETDRNYNANRCPKCMSTLTYFRLKLKEFICRSCGNTWKRARQ